MPHPFAQLPCTRHCLTLPPCHLVSLSPSLYLDHKLHLHRRSERQRHAPHRCSRVLARFSQHLHQKLAGAIGDFRLVEKPRLRAHENAQPHNLPDRTERTRRRLHHRQPVQHALPRAFLRLLRAHLPRHAPPVDQLPIAHRNLSAHKEQVPCPPPRDVRCHRLG